MSLKRMETRLRLRCRPPLKASARKPAEAKPIAMAVEGQDFESGAASIPKNEDVALVRICRQFSPAESNQSINPLPKVDGLISQKDI